MALKNAIQRFKTPASVLDQDKLRQFCEQIVEATSIRDCKPRADIIVVGEITNVRIVPRPDGSPWLEATVKDGTGSLTIMWTGRTRIAGVHAGRRLIVSGRGAPTGRGGRLMVTNPRYQLLA